MPRTPKPTWANVDDRNRPESDEMEIIMAAFRKMFADGIPTAAGAAAIGTVKDGGPGMTTSLGVTGARVTSADASGAALSVTDAPTSGQKLVFTDIIVSSDTALRLDFKIETAGTILFSIYMGAGTTVNLVPRGKLKLATADKKLQVQASVAGNIGVTALYYSEA